MFCLDYISLLFSPPLEGWNTGSKTFISSCSAAALVLADFLTGIVLCPFKPTVTAWCDGAAGVFCCLLISTKVTQCRASLKDPTDVKQLCSTTQVKLIQVSLPQNHPDTPHVVLKLGVDLVSTYLRSVRWSCALVHVVNVHLLTQTINISLTASPFKHLISCCRLWWSNCRESSWIAPCITLSCYCMIPFFTVKFN